MMWSRVKLLKIKKICHSARAIGVTFLILLATYSFAQKTKTVAGSSKAIVVLQDSSAIIVRKPSEAQIEKYRTNRDYDYSRDTAPPQNPLAKFWVWIKQKLSDFFASKAYQSVWQYVILASLLALTVWLLYKSGFLGGFAKTGRDYAEELGYETLMENIHELNFTDMIEEAIAQRNYRLAVRLYYLKTLKELTDRNLIKWQPTKTNRSYLYELSDLNLRSDFEQLTEQFEYVWYGEFEVSNSDFEQIQQDFKSFLGFHQRKVSDDSI
jgi:Domain of unknown function (DUF4129)